MNEQVCLWLCYVHLRFFSAHALVVISAYLPLFEVDFNMVCATNVIPSG